jgi:hypothetical protein
MRETDNGKTHPATFGTTMPVCFLCESSGVEMRRVWRHSPIVDGGSQILSSAEIETARSRISEFYGNGVFGHNMPSADLLDAIRSEPTATDGFVCRIDRAELGFSLTEIRELIILQGERVEACSHVRDMLTTKLGAVRHKISELRKLERHLVADLKECERILQIRSENHKTCPVLGFLAKPAPRRRR